MQTIAAQPDLFDDDLFAVAPLTIRATTSRVHCQVCGLVTEVPLFAPARLCGPCSADPDTLRGELTQRQVALVEKQAALCNEMDALEASLLLPSCHPHYTDDDKARWQNIKIARARGVKADRIAAIMADPADVIGSVLRFEAETAQKMHFYADRIAALQRGIDELALIARIATND